MSSGRDGGEEKEVGFLRLLGLGCSVKSGRKDMVVVGTLNNKNGETEYRPLQLDVAVAGHLCVSADAIRCSLVGSESNQSINLKESNQLDSDSVLVATKRFSFLMMALLSERAWSALDTAGEKKE